MGNRGTVIFANKTWTEFSPAIYLHWNGGPESVFTFIEELDRRDVRADQMYEAARFCQIVGEFFDQDGVSSHSLGICNGPKSLDAAELGKVQTDHGDNGFYIVCREGEQWEVRRFAEHYLGDDSKLDYPFILREFDKSEVEAEMKEWKTHEYRKNIGEWFVERKPIPEGSKVF